jgi:hypothetical protein
MSPVEHRSPPLRLSGNHVQVRDEVLDRPVPEGVAQRIVATQAYVDHVVSLPPVISHDTVKQIAKHGGIAIGNGNTHGVKRTE